MLGLSAPVQAQTTKPNILFIVSDDTGYGDLGPYGGGEGRGMPTPNIDKLAGEGMTFFSFYAQPSCTPGRAAMQTGRIPNRSGMTTVAFQGQGGGLPAAEWTLASVLKQGGYQTYFTGKWHLGEADYALPNAQGYDEMKYVGLYHLNAYTYARPDLVPRHGPGAAGDVPAGDQGRAVGQGGSAGRRKTSRSTGSTSTRPEKGRRRHSVLRRLRREGGAGVPRHGGKTPDKPFFINVNFMKVHQPNMPAPEFEHKSMSKSKYADSVVELDTRIGRIMDKLRALGLDKNTLVFYTTDNGAWQDVYPDAGYTPFRGTKGTVREGGNRVPAIAVWPGKIKPGIKNHDIVGGLDLMATFASVAGVKLPDKDREGQPIIFDSYDMSPILLRHRQVGAQIVVLLHRERAVARRRPRRQLQGRVQSARRRRTATGGLAVDTNLGWKGADKYVATVPQVFDLWQDPQERYDIFMNNYHRAHLDDGHHQRCDQGTDEDLRAIPATQAAER